MSNNNPHNDNNTNPGIPVACDTPAEYHNPHCTTTEEDNTMPDNIEDIIIDICNTVVCDEDGYIINHPIDEEYGKDFCDGYEDASFCGGDSDQGEYEFTPPPFDCFAGPDPDTQEYIDSNWEQQLEDNGCFNDVELGEPQAIEGVELGPATVIEQTTTEVTEPAADILPETGLDTLGFGLIGVLLVIVGVAVLRRFRKVEVEPCGYCGDSLNPNDICKDCFPTPEGCADGACGDDFCINCNPF